MWTLAGSCLSLWSRHSHFPPSLVYSPLFLVSVLLLLPMYFIFSSPTEFDFHPPYKYYPQLFLRYSLQQTHALQVELSQADQREIFHRESLDIFEEGRGLIIPETTLTIK